jgi:hypothetical protein
MCNTYATPVTRATVDEFCPGFSAFRVRPRSMSIAVRQNTAFHYILFCGILVALSNFFHISFIRYISSISTLLVCS